ncbi:MAG: hypothetical protein AAGJ09_10745 [Pseudomonadota bacterium]
MSSAPNVLLIEFNELTPHLMDQFIDDGDLPNFKALRDRSATAITKADVETAENLEPWIQWYSLHSGLTYDQHGVFHLTDGPHSPHKDIFEILLNEGLTVGCGGSMNVKGFASEGSFFIADPWCAGQRSYPEALAVFQDFIASQVREYSNPEGDGGKVTPLQFVSFMAKNGLSTKTIASIIKQLSEEKIVSGSLSWKRPAILDRLNVDVFAGLYRRYRPRFATFFSNSTAHLQHAYWRCMDPDAFTVQPSQEERDRYRDAIRFGYKSMDKYLPELLQLVRPEDTVIFATALSQQPFLRKEETGGQRFYRPRSVETLMAAIDVDYASLEPTMTHQFMLRAASAQKAEEAAQKLRGLYLEGQALFEVDSKGGDDTVYFGAQISDQVDMQSSLENRESGATLAFADFFYQIDGMKSGCHHPDGILWMSGPDIAAGPIAKERVELTDVFPTILERLGHASAIPTDRQGESLWPLLPKTAIRKAS